MGYIRLYVAISIAPHASTIPKTSGTVRRSPSHRTAPFENWRISAADETLAQRTSVRPEPPLLSCVRPAPDLVAASLTRWTNSTSDSCSSAEAPSPDGCRRASLGHQCGHLLSRRDANLARLNERPAQRGRQGTRCRPTRGCTRRSRSWRIGPALRGAGPSSEPDVPVSRHPEGVRLTV